MGEKDITEKMLEAHKDVFADIANVLLFDGRRVIEESALSPAVARSQLKIGGGVTDQERDVAMYWGDCLVNIAFLGLENQTDEDKYMPMRVISYDGAAYKSMLATDGIVPSPAVTLVLYFGADHRWRKPKSLLECFEVPDMLAPYVSDYRINVFDIAFLDERRITQFRSDFRFVAELLRCQRLNIDYDPAHMGKIAHVRELLHLMRAMTNDDGFEAVYNAGTMRDGDTTMCEVLDRIRTKGRQEGMAEGRLAGIAEGRLAGIAEGRLAGMAEGRLGGIADLSTVMREFLRQGKHEEALRLVEDDRYRSQVMSDRFGG